MLRQLECLRLHMHHQVGSTDRLILHRHQEQLRSLASVVALLVQVAVNLFLRWSEEWYPAHKVLGGMQHVWSVEGRVQQEGIVEKSRKGNRGAARDWIALRKAPRMAVFGVEGVW